MARRHENEYKQKNKKVNGETIAEQRGKNGEKRRLASHTEEKHEKTKKTRRKPRAKRADSTFNGCKQPCIKNLYRARALGLFLFFFNAYSALYCCVRQVLKIQLLAKSVERTKGKKTVEKGKKSDGVRGDKQTTTFPPSAAPLFLEIEK